MCWSENAEKGGKKALLVNPLADRIDTPATRPASPGFIKGSRLQPRCVNMGAYCNNNNHIKEEELVRKEAERLMFSDQELPDKSGNSFSSSSSMI